MSFFLVLFWLASPPAQAQEYAFRTYTQEDGLDNLSVSALTQDPLGFIWVGTENGLYRFDGGKFERIGARQGLGEPYVSALHVTPAAVLWVATQGGLYRWNGRSFDEAVRDGQPVPVQQGDALATLDARRLLVVSGDELLVVTHDGPADGPASGSGAAPARWRARPYFTPAQKSAHPELKKIWSVRVFGAGEQGGGDIWLGCGDSLCEVREGRLLVWGAAQGVPVGYWPSVVRDSDGTVWVRGKRELLSLAPGASRFVSRISMQSSLKDVRIFLPMVLDRDRRLITFGDDGLLRLDLGSLKAGETPVWEHVTEANGLPVREASALLVDHDGELWVGSAGLGLSHWVGYRSWLAWTAHQGLPHESVWSFTRDAAGRFLIGTDRGMAELRMEDKVTAARIIAAPGAEVVQDHQVGSLTLDHSGRLWGGTFSGLLFYQEPRERSIGGGAPQSGPGPITVVARLLLIAQVFADASGRVWVLTHHGKGPLVIDHPDGPDPRPVPAEGTSFMPRDISFSGMCQTSSGALWFASDKGVFRFADGRWSSPAIPGAPKAAAFTTIACARDGSLWIGGETTRLVHVRPAGVETLQAMNDFPVDALGGRQVLAIMQDRRGWIWLSTDGGVLVWSDGALRLFTHENGLAWNDCNQGALKEDADGSIWVGTSKGLAHIIRPDLLFGRIVPPRVV